MNSTVDNHRTVSGGRQSRPRTDGDPRRCPAPTRSSHRQWCAESIRTDEPANRLRRQRSPHRTADGSCPSPAAPSFDLHRACGRSSRRRADHPALCGTDELGAIQIIPYPITQRVGDTRGSSCRQEYRRDRRTRTAHRNNSCDRGRCPIWCGISHDQKRYPFTLRTVKKRSSSAAGCCSPLNHGSGRAARHGARLAAR